ncbi:elongation of very long chain fatty acids protein 4-like, partial [Sinocyclocheilus rhinocerous]|uniref:elongation of very long chain fatty acids protein 4-like n=1 Tax=Sinocyclocheilus rhinocerous TaxID=307959 RepID=UPI0007B8B736
KRTDPWLLIYSPVPIICIFLCYLGIIWIGPKLMKHKEPMNIKALLIVYNFAMVGLSIYMFHEFFVTSWLANYSFLCQPVDYSPSPLGMRMASVCWWFFFSKVIELSDTVFFILRKKNSQLTFLHVYHHGTMIFNWWAGVKFVAGGQSFFIGLLNTFVHIVMYSYYGLAALGPHMQIYLWWKRYLTSLQLVSPGITGTSVVKQEGKGNPTIRKGSMNWVALLPTQRSVPVVFTQCACGEAIRNTAR